MRPLHRVAQEVARRAPDCLEPISDQGTPHEVHSLLTALNQLFQRVANAIQRERRFTADAAHELRTPLAALKTHLQVARNHSKDAATRRSLDQALAGVDRATHSVVQLLALARAEADQRRMLMNARVDLREVAADVVATLSQEAVDRNIDLGLDAPVPVFVKGDSTSLQILSRNLVDNAIRYTQSGGAVTVSVKLAEDHPVLSVADNGQGIAEAERESIFNRFYRGSEEKTKGTTGSGLGLSLVQQLVELHNATLDLGKGLDDTGLGIAVQFPAGSRAT
jgi:two-component system sensor histidine kinase QseC